MSSGDAQPVRLTAAALPTLPAAVLRPAYDPAATRIGIVHIGTGAFHRVHQAMYVDDLLAAHPDWAICGVSLHSTEVRDALRPQDGLYTVALLSDQPALRVVGAIRELLCARDEQLAVLARLADPAVRLVTLTITEKGYCLAGEDLDLSHVDILHDLAAPQSPRSAIGFLTAALDTRRTRGIEPFTVLSCDNLAANGHRLRRAVLQFAQQMDAGLAAWIAEHVAFPCSMVDSITPATDAALRERVAGALGCTDAWPVQREAFTQWVIEDRFCNARPPFEQAGATLSHDIAGYDRAKLRLLNGAHSTLAYLGALLGLETVRDAMHTAPLARFVEQLMRRSIAPVIALPAGLDADAYIDAILDRFRNPAVRHQLLQIAWDGSQKLPVRLLGTIAEALHQGRDISALCLAIAAWMRFVRRQAVSGIALVDPLDATLRAIGRATTGEAAHDVAAFLRLDSVFGELATGKRFVATLHQSYAALGDGSPGAVLRALPA
jgi:fructuronate reductase